jgi:hypothetical protein
MVTESIASNNSLEALRIFAAKGESATEVRKLGVLLPMIFLATAIGATTAYEDPH